MLRVQPNLCLYFSSPCCVGCDGAGDGAGGGGGGDGGGDGGAEETG